MARAHWFFAAGLAAALVGLPASAQETRPGAPRDPEALLAAADAAFAAAEAADSGGRPGIFVRSAYAEAETAYRAVAAQEHLPPAAAAKAWLGVGWSAARAGRLEDGLSAFDRAEEVDPGAAADAVFSAARALFEAGKSSEALARLSPYLDDAESPFRGDAFLLAMGIKLETGDRTEARELFRADYDGLPFASQMEAWRLLAGRFRDLPGDSFYADLLQERLTAAPKDPASTFWQGDRLLARGKLPEALARFRSFRTFRPFDLEGAVWTAVAEIRNGLLDAGRETLAAVAAATPDPATASAALAAARELTFGLYGAKRFAEAAKNQEDVAERSGEFQDLLDAASLWKDAADYDASSRLFDRLLAREDVRGARRAKAANDRGLLEAGRGRETEAEAWFRQAIAAWDDERDARENLGILLLKSGRSEEGRALLEWCVARENARVRSRYHLFRSEHPEVGGAPAR